MAPAARNPAARAPISMTCQEPPPSSHIDTAARGAVSTPIKMVGSSHRSAMAPTNWDVKAAAAADITIRIKMSIRTYYIKQNQKILFSLESLQCTEYLTART
jgi:hypothetical protein